MNAHVSGIQWSGCSLRSRIAELNEVRIKATPRPGKKPERDRRELEFRHDRGSGADVGTVEAPTVPPELVTDLTLLPHPPVRQRAQRAALTALADSSSSSSACPFRHALRSQVLLHHGDRRNEIAPISDQKVSVPRVPAHVKKRQGRSKMFEVRLVMRQRSRVEGLPPNGAPAQRRGG